MGSHWVPETMWDIPVITVSMMTSSFCALLAICAGSSPVPGEFPAQRPVTRSFDVSFDLRFKNKQSWCWWFDTPSCSLWRHCNGTSVYIEIVQLKGVTLNMNLKSAEIKYKCDDPFSIFTDQFLVYIFIRCVDIYFRSSVLAERNPSFLFTPRQLPLCTWVEEYIDTVKITQFGLIWPRWLPW